VGAYALTVAASPIIGVFIVGARGGLHTDPGPESSFSEVTPNLGWLLIGSIMSAALVNAGPLGVNILADSSEAAKVTAFGNGVLLSRVPLFLFQAVQAALLPRLARLAAQGDLREFREGLRRLMAVVVGVGIIGVLGSFAVGPAVLDVVYDGGLDRSTLTMLAASSAIFMLALATSQAVIALQGHRLVALGWVIGMSSFVIVTAVASDDLFWRVEMGLIVGTTLALVVFLLSLRSRIAAGATPDVESMIDGVLESPLEN
jgi:O-antigen/teichoic acid export membrane protein